MIDWPVVALVAVSLIGLVTNTVSMYRVRRPWLYEPNPWFGIISAISTLAIFACMYYVITTR